MASRLSMSLRFRPSRHLHSHRLSELPSDILIEIAEKLSTQDILKFSLASNYTRALLMPLLYETMILKSSSTCRSALKMLKRNPLICRVVKKLAVRPNYYLAWPKRNEHLDEDWVADQLMAISRELVVLNTFDWDGLDMPKDDLWYALKESCPLLTMIYANVGLEPLNPNSHLFNFDNLTGFSLTVRHGLGGSDLFPPLETMPENLWTMLIKRCPDLEELTICSFSSSLRILDVGPVATATFPKLHTLTLGSFGYQSDFTLTPSLLTLSEFLERHQTLRYLRFSWNFKRWLSPDDVSLVLPGNVTTFVGIYQQLDDLPNPSVLQCLDLTCEPIYGGRTDPLARFLRRCISLVSLDLWMHIDQITSLTWSDALRDLLGTCTGRIEEFHFMCTTPFGKEALSRLMFIIMTKIPLLKTFSLTKGHAYLDEPMAQSALRIITKMPSLDQVNLRWAREQCVNHLKQEGTYDVVRSEEGRITAILGVERGITALGTTFSRKWTHRYRGKQSKGRTMTVLQAPVTSSLRGRKD